MQFLSRDFYNNTNIISYINSSIQVLTNSNQNILSSKEYLLFYYIKENFTTNFYSLYNTDIDMECLVFSIIQRNTRHSIESYLDLVNLTSDSAYLSVLKYCANQETTFDAKFKPYKKTYGFNIPAKYNIATKLYKKKIPSELLEVSSDSNKHIHPNVFIDIINMDEFSRKSMILRKLLNWNLFILSEAFTLIVQKFNDGQFPIINCQNCNPFLPRDCSICFKNERARFQNLIDNGLITYTAPAGSNYQQPPAVN